MKKHINMDLDVSDQKRESVTRKKGSKNLYVCFYYFNKKIEKTTGLLDTPKNRKNIREWLDRIFDKIDQGTFRFAEAFPGASEEEKSHFAKLEGWEYTPEPNQILFKDYVEEWYPDVWSHYPEGTKKDDYRQIINCWLLPHFGEMTFYQISGVELQKFISTLKWKKGKRKGETLSKQRIKNILIPLKAIWLDACDQYRWNLHNPFSNLKKHLPRTVKKRREGFRFDEWQAFLSHVDPWYQPILELMILTGMSNSELAGLKKAYIKPDYIQVQNTIVKGLEHDTPKTPYRIRRLPITQAIRKRLDVLLKRSTGERIITTEKDTVFHAANFRKNVWEKALNASGIINKVPYSLRHSFAAWSLTIRIDPNKLVRLMGHGSKKMVYEVYGDYIEGLEEDYWKILEYMGKDFIQPKGKAPAIFQNFVESSVESQGPDPYIHAV